MSKWGGRNYYSVPAGYYREVASGKIMPARVLPRSKKRDCPCYYLDDEYNALMRRARFCFPSVFRVVWEIEVHATSFPEEIVMQIGPVLTRYKQEPLSRLKLKKKDAEIEAKAILKEIIVYCRASSNYLPYLSDYNVSIEKKIQCIKCGDVENLYYWVQENLPKKFARLRKNYRYEFYEDETTEQDGYADLSFCYGAEYRTYKVQNIERRE